MPDDPSSAPVELPPPGGVDAAFFGGEGHPVCQDYALAWGRDSVAVADGCSGEPHTDVGARHLVWSWRKYVHHRSNVFNSDAIRTGFVCSCVGHTVQDAVRALDEMGVSQSAAHATLLAIQRGDASGDSEAAAMIAGDGVAAGRRRDGSSDIWTYTFQGEDGKPAGCPYPLYLVQPNGWRNWLARFGGAVRIEHIRLSAEGEVLIRGSATHPQPMSYPAMIRLPRSEYELGAVFTDGVLAVRQHARTETARSHEPVPVEAVVRELLAVKSPAGAFVGRRLRAFRQTMIDRNWFASDDLAMGAMFL